MARTLTAICGVLLVLATVGFLGQRRFLAGLLSLGGGVLILAIVWQWDAVTY